MSARTPLNSSGRSMTLTRSTAAAPPKYATAYAPARQDSRKRLPHVPTHHADESELHTAMLTTESAVIIGTPASIGKLWCERCCEGAYEV